MNKLWRSHGLAVFVTVLLTAGVVWAETLEFVTYYPAAGQGLPDPLYVNRAAIGAGYNGIPPPANSLTVEGQLGIGTDTPTGRLHLVLPDTVSERVIFEEGTGAGREINFSFGRATPANQLSGIDAVRDYDALYLRLRSTGVGDPDNYVAINLNADLGAVSNETDDRIWQIGNSRVGGVGSALHNDLRFLFWDRTLGGGFQPILVLKDTMTPTADVPMVGIGTQEPTSTIGINGNAARMIQLERHTAAGTGGNPLFLRAGGATVGAIDREGGTLFVSGGISTGTEGSKVQFLTATPGTVSGTTDHSPTTKMTIAGNGNVGIGETAPTSALTVRRDGDASYVSFVGAGDGDNYAALNMYDLGTSRFWQIAHKQAAGNVNKFQIAYNANPGWSFPFTITTGGFIGLNTDAPTDRLHVIGNIRASGDAYANSFTPTSDARLKTDVLPLTGVLQKIDRLHGVTFRWTDAYAAEGGADASRREIGLMAQEVEQVYPELVRQIGGSELKGIDYDKMTAVLLEAVKELKAENEALRKRIELLEKKEIPSE